MSRIQRDKRLLSISIFPLYFTMSMQELFDELHDSLQPAVDESISFDGFTHTPPDGWTITNADGMRVGTTEWQGWSFTTLDFWQAVDGGYGGQTRAEFSLSDGVLAVADADEWSDVTHADGGSFDSTLTSPPISIEAATVVEVKFDSHWRPYDEMTGILWVSFDGDKPMELAFL